MYIIFLIIKTLSFLLLINFLRWWWYNNFSCFAQLHFFVCKTEIQFFEILFFKIISTLYDYQKWEAHFWIILLGPNRAQQITLPCPSVCPYDNSSLIAWLLGSPFCAVILCRWGGQSENLLLQKKKHNLQWWWWCREAIFLKRNRALERSWRHFLQNKAELTRMLL